MRPLITMLVGIALFAAPGMRAQTASTATTVQKQLATAAAKPAAPTSAKTAAQSTTPAPVKPAAKPLAKAKTKPAGKAAAKPATPVAKKVSDKKPAEREQKIARRDPFESLVGRKQAQDAMAKNLPPGKAGLQVSTLRLDGIVKASNGMIAVVANPQQRTYFLREGDQLYDGKVEKISMEGVTFHEEGKDAFGKPVEREVNKRLYTSAGEQQ